MIRILKYRDIENLHHFFRTKHLITLHVQSTYLKLFWWAPLFCWPAGVMCGAFALWRQMNLYQVRVELENSGGSKAQDSIWTRVWAAIINFKDALDFCTGTDFSGYPANQKRLIPNIRCGQMPDICFFSLPVNFIVDVDPNWVRFSEIVDPDPVIRIRIHTIKIRKRGSTFSIRQFLN